jgi:transposase, IS5 family
MKQRSLSSQGVFEKYGRKSRRELFLDEMEQVVPWSALEALVRPHYAKAGKGRQPVGLGIMLRTYFVQQWFNLSDPGVEEALYESAALRRFVGVDLGVAPAPDETTILRFRHLLERHELGGLMLDAVNVHLDARASGSRRARSSMRPSCMRLRRPRTRMASATRRCTRPGRATSGTS